MIVSVSDYAIHLPRIASQLSRAAIFLHHIAGHIKVAEPLPGLNPVVGTVVPTVGNFAALCVQGVSETGEDNTTDPKQ